MSYSFSLTVKDGVVAVSEGSNTTHVPDGKFTIAGHEDAGSRSISVMRTGSDGRGVAQANAVGYLPAVES